MEGNNINSYHFPLRLHRLTVVRHHVLVSAMIGTGLATKAKVNTRVTEMFGVGWILSFIIPGMFAGVITLIARLF